MGKIENLIRAEALLNNDTTHNKVCKEIVSFSEQNNVPMALLLYIAVGTMAHKEDAFKKGYKSFQHEKATKVMLMSKMVANYFNTPNARTNDKIVHFCSRYYTYQGGNVTNFQNILKTKPKDNFSLKNFKNAKEFGNFLFGDCSKFTDKGYIVQTIVKKQY